MIEKKPEIIRNFPARVEQMAKRMSTSFSCPFVTGFTGSRLSAS